MVKLKIDPEFRDKIPALTEAEYEQLKENILSDGEVYEPIVTWNDTIVDGHNRWRIICENWETLKDKFRTKPMDFADKWEAFEWMYKKQLGRRNLTEEQRTVLIGQMALARMKSHGGNRGTEQDADGRFTASGQNGALRKSERTRDVIAKELGVGARTVDRAVQFAKGIDALRESNPEAADAVLKGNSGATKAEVSELPNKTAGEIKKVAEDILSGEIKKKREKTSKEDREAISKIVEVMYNPDAMPEFTIDFLIEDIQLNGAAYVDLLRSTLTDRSTLLTPENRPNVAKAIQEIIDKIQKVKELIEK